MIDIRKSHKIALFSHVRPDGDTLGAMFAMRLGLLSLGKEVDCYCDGEMPQYLSYLDQDQIFNQKTIDHYDTAISLDCAERNRLGVYESLFVTASTTIDIDHHMTNPGYATIDRIEDRASTCEIVYAVLTEWGVAITRDIATCLYTGLSTDTGNFSQANTTENSHLVAAHLMRAGVDAEWLSNRLFKEMRKQKLQLIIDRLSEIRFYDHDRISVLTVDMSDLEKYGLKISSTEGLINYALNITGVMIAVCLSESAHRQYKVSLRSKRGINVAEVAKAFGGGGHVQASGCMLSGLKEEVVEKLVRQCAFALPLQD